MNKFKIGDKVRCINNEYMPSLHVGETYEIRDVNYHDDRNIVYLHKFHESVYFNSSGFELVETSSESRFYLSSIDEKGNVETLFQIYDSNDIHCLFKVELQRLIHEKNKSAIQQLLEKYMKLESSDFSQQCRIFTDLMFDITVKK